MSGMILRSEDKKMKFNVKNMLFLGEASDEHCFYRLRNILEEYEDTKVFIHTYDKYSMLPSKMDGYDNVTVGSYETPDNIKVALDYINANVSRRLKLLFDSNVENIKYYNSKKGNNLERYVFVLVLPERFDSETYSAYYDAMKKYYKLNSKDTGIHLAVCSRYPNLVPKSMRYMFNLSVTDFGM